MQNIKMQSPNPEYKQYVMLKMERNHYGKMLGFEIQKIEPGRIEAVMEFKEIHEQQNGFLHGAVISALCDMAAGFAAYTLVNEGEQIFTAEIKVSYFRPGTAKIIHAHGWVEKAGKNLHFCEAEIFQIIENEKKVIAKSSSTMAIVRDKHFKDKYS
jgi:uncharacterized protein (TIGR00369 family)